VSAGIDRPRVEARDRAGPLTPSAPRLLILGGDADFNLGDRAILHGLCLALLRADRSARITITSNTLEPASLPGVVAVIPRGAGALPRLLRAAARQDLVIVGGGGLFQDDDSRVKMPYWAARLRLLARTNPRLVGHALGAGPLRHTESRVCARLACDVLESVSVRDHFARDWLQPCTSRHVELVPDPAFMLPPAPTAAVDAVLRRLRIEPGRPLVGVALRRWFHRRGGVVPNRARAALGLGTQEGVADMAGFLDQLAGVLQALAADLGADVLLLPSYHVAHEGDLQACRQLAGRLGERHTRVAVIREPCLYKGVCGRLSIMLSARMHPLILAAGMGVPVVGLGYNGKFGGVFRLLGLSGRVIPLDAFRAASQGDRLFAAVRTALTEPVDLRARCEGLAARTLTATRTLLGSGLAAGAKAE
jgi:polysaccharide pyruvyl transferase WcaK-like protein